MQKEHVSFFINLYCLLTEPQSFLNSESKHQYGVFSAHILPFTNALFPE